MLCGEFGLIKKRDIFYSIFRKAPSVKHTKFLLKMFYWHLQRFIKLKKCVYEYMDIICNTTV